MHREKASRAAVAVAEVVGPTAATLGLDGPPHPDTSSPRSARPASAKARCTNELTLAMVARRNNSRTKRR
jgi:hypothetical protein